MLQLYLGYYLNIDSILAFAPQTFIDKKNRYLNFDFRWKKEIKLIHRSISYSPYFDIKKLIENNQNHTLLKLISFIVRTID